MSPEGRDLGQEAGPGRDKVSSFDSWPEKGQRCFEGQTAPGAVHGEPAQRFRRREIQHEEIQQQNGGQAKAANLPCHLHALYSSATEPSCGSLGPS
jgi:hypothetical protein